MELERLRHINVFPQQEVEQWISQGWVPVVIAERVARVLGVCPSSLVHPDIARLALRDT